ncbi:MAG TPA: zf-HC2 domain-containing protein [Verrucomicrobiae bacterium]
MNHPEREEWVPFLYGEAKPEMRRQLAAHLDACAECRAEIEGWQRSLRRLDHWRLPAKRLRAEWFPPVLRWAAATALVLGLGIGLGRFTAGGADAEKVRARIEPQLRETLRQEMTLLVREEMSRTSATTLAAAGDQAEKLLAAYNTIQQTRRAEDLDRLYLAIKKQLDTVAINTQREFVQLADYVRPTDPNRSLQQ